MLKLGKHVQLSKKRIAWITASVLVVALGIGACNCKNLMNTKLLSDAPDNMPSIAAAKQGEETNAPSTDDAAPSTSPSSTNNQTKSLNDGTKTQSFSMQPKASEVLPDSDQDDGKNCGNLMGSAVSDYNHEVSQKKTDLDNSIKFPPVPVSISSGYVLSYNNAITELFNEYVSTSLKEHCTWPLKAPNLLPVTYPNS